MNPLHISPEDPTPDPLREQIAQGIQAVAAEGKLSAKKGAGIRAQYFLRPLEAALFKLTTLAVSTILARPVAQALVIRLALYRLARDANAALKDAALAAQLREEILDVRNDKASG